MGVFDDLLAGVYSATVTEAEVLVREVRVRIGVLSQPVRIRIYYDGKRMEPYSFEMTEFVKTADGGHPRDTSRLAASEAEALRRAVRMLTEDYEAAVRGGELPDDSWLVQGDLS
ncbi:MAG TPA: hypothetical protein VF911_14040 [Thermoanaerobaculia bacterium]|jgi:hypothetical protein